MGFLLPALWKEGEHGRALSWVGLSNSQHPTGAHVCTHSCTAFLTPGPLPQNLHLGLPPDTPCMHPFYAYFHILTPPSPIMSTSPQLPYLSHLPVHLLSPHKKTLNSPYLLQPPLTSNPSLHIPIHEKPSSILPLPSLRSLPPHKNTATHSSSRITSRMHPLRQTPISQTLYMISQRQSPALGDPKQTLEDATDLQSILSETSHRFGSRSFGI